MPFKIGEVSSRCRLPKPNGVVLASRGHNVTFGTENGCIDPIVVSECGSILPRTNIPNVHAILTCGNESLAIRTECHGVDLGFVVFQRRKTFACLGVPQSHRFIPTTRSQSFPIGTELNRHYKARMSFQRQAFARFQEPQPHRRLKATRCNHLAERLGHGGGAAHGSSNLPETTVSSVC